MEALRGNIASDLIGESLELAETHAVALSEVVLVAELHCKLARLHVVASDKKHILATHISYYMLHTIVVALVSIVNSVPDG